MVHIYAKINTEDDEFWQELSMEKDSSFDFVLSNRLFESVDSYSFNIDFPLVDCISNLPLKHNLEDGYTTPLAKIVLFDKVIFGELLLLEMTDKKASMQFVERNLNNTLESVYLNSLDIMEYSTPNTAIQVTGPDNFACVPLPWYNETTDVFHNPEIPADRTFMPYLIDLTQRICNSAGVQCDLTEWESTDFKYLVCCNVLPKKWNLNYARALPHWTLREYFDHLGYLLHGTFKVDSDNVLRFRFAGTLQQSVVSLKNVIDEFSMTIAEPDECDYLFNRNIKYASDDARVRKFYDCSETIETIERLYGYSLYTFPTQGNVDRIISYSGNASNKLLMCNGHLFIHSKVNVYQQDPDNMYISHFQILNDFAAVRNYDGDFTEVKIVPAAIDYHELPVAGTQGKRCVFLAPKEWEEDIEDPDPEVKVPIIEKAVDNADIDKKAEYYSLIYVGYWCMEKTGYGGTDDQNTHLGLAGATPIPVISQFDVKEGNHTKKYTAGWSLHLGTDNPNVPSNMNRYHIDPKVLYKFSFLSKDVPDVNAVFLIKGNRYICKNLKVVYNAAFGKSDKIEGEFYRIRNAISNVISILR